MQSVTPPPATAAGASPRGLRSWAKRELEILALNAHRQAERFDLVPPEFGTGTPVDETDARAVVGEWIRLFRQWAGYNPEQVFALKVGATLLAVALIALWFLVGMIG